jgi:haloalkane dehalogenase
VNVNGYRIHFTDEGEGDPILFIHGNPTSSLLWRNIAPQVGRALKHRSLAIDLLGFGRSDKPNVRYTLPLHYEVVRGFIEALGLTNLALVLQEWGGTIGTRYAVGHPENVRAVAAMESGLRIILICASGRAGSLCLCCRR